MLRPISESPVDLAYAAAKRTFNATEGLESSPATFLLSRVLTIPSTLAKGAMAKAGNVLPFSSTMPWACLRRDELKSFPSAWGLQ